MNIRQKIDALYLIPGALCQIKNAEDSNFGMKFLIKGVTDPYYNSCYDIVWQDGTTDQTTSDWIWLNAEFL